MVKRCGQCRIWQLVMHDFSSKRTSHSATELAIKDDVVDCMEMLTPDCLC